MLKYTLGDTMTVNVSKIFDLEGISLTETQLEQFEIYYRLLVDWNEKINLTAITEKEEVYQKHFVDSLSLRNVIPTSSSLLDVGSGAGFPSIPLKILDPSINVTIIDALQKRITFLELLCKELGVEVELIHGRAEEFDRKNQYDFVTARAVANLNMLSELCIPFVKVGGYFISMKGPKFQEELKQCETAFEILGANYEDKIHYTINEEQKTLLKIRKVSETSDKYPRKFKKIKSKPL